MSAQDLPLAREELLRTRRDQRRLHDEQSRGLARRHQRESSRIDEPRRGRISEADGARLSVDMEGAHERELAGLRQDHEREQSEMTDPVFESAAVAVVGNLHGYEVVL